MLNVNPQPKPRLTFRPIDHTDICFVHNVRTSAREFLHDNRIFSLQDVIEFVVIKKPKWFIIEAVDPVDQRWRDSQHGNRIGYFRTTGGLLSEIEIGCDLHKDYQHKGLGKAAYLQFITSLFSEAKGYKKITLKVMASNSYALNLYLSLGFKITETELIVRSFNQSGYKEVSLSMELTKEDWLAKTN